MNRQVPDLATRVQQRVRHAADPISLAVASTLPIFVLSVHLILRGRGGLDSVPGTLALLGMGFSFSIPLILLGLTGVRLEPIVWVYAIITSVSLALTVITFLAYVILEFLLGMRVLQVLAWLDFTISSVLALGGNALVVGICLVKRRKVKASGATPRTEGR